MDIAKKHKELLGRADLMRQNMTKAESKLNIVLVDPKNNFPVFHPQHVIYPYIVDFVCLEILLIIEVDGISHYISRDSDGIRQNELEKLGYKILRFTNGEVLVDLETVKERIQFECRYRQSTIKKPSNRIKKKSKKRMMIVPLPRVVYEAPAIEQSYSRAGKVRTRRALDKSKGEKARIFCFICKNPIANSDLRIRYRKIESETVLWVHKSCAD
jgi:very-short-patch-repair endonuclease